LALLSRFLSLFSSQSSLPPRSTLFPYTTLFRSQLGLVGRSVVVYQPESELSRSVCRSAHGAWPGAGGDESGQAPCALRQTLRERDRKSTRLNSSHSQISYAVFCLKKKKTTHSNI